MIEKIYCKRATADRAGTRLNRVGKEESAWRDAPGLSRHDENAFRKDGDIAITHCNLRNPCDIMEGKRGWAPESDKKTRSLGYARK